MHAQVSCAVHALAQDGMGGLLEMLLSRDDYRLHVQVVILAVADRLWLAHLGVGSVVFPQTHLGAPAQFAVRGNVAILTYGCS
ncbi:hypothetical protein [Mycobacterium uberis]|uniref:hypothetical protein n=1 Tax=Mycobacterium uberis TaxID=2162698 RepID=UPI001402410E|nr:hypothetical protein [Mycobacterium uberis]